MFDSIVNWLERVLKPIITVSDGGRSYLERTPTLNDLAVRKRTRYMRRYYNTTPGGGATTGTEYYTLSSQTVIVTGIAIIKTTANGTSAWYGISENTAVNAEQKMTSTPLAVSINSPGSLLNWSQPIVVMAGDTLNISIIGGGGVNTQAWIYISFIEVE